MDKFDTAYNKYTKFLKSIDNELISYKKETRSAKLDDIHASILLDVTAIKSRLNSDKKTFVKTNNKDAKYFREKLELVQQDTNKKLDTYNRLTQQKKTRHHISEV